MQKKKTNLQLLRKKKPQNALIYVNTIELFTSFAHPLQPPPTLSQPMLRKDCKGKEPRYEVGKEQDSRQRIKPVAHIQNANQVKLQCHMRNIVMIQRCLTVSQECKPISHMQHNQLKKAYMTSTLKEILSFASYYIHFQVNLL